MYAGSNDATFALAESTGSVLRSLPSGANRGGSAVVDGSVIVGNDIDDVLVRYTIPAGTSSTTGRPDPARLTPTIKA